MAKLIPAFVLCDVVAHNLKAGDLVEADADLIKALQKDGSVDPHKDAVAAARERGAKMTRSSIEVAAEHRAAQLEALRVDVAKLQDLVSKEENADTKAALEKDLSAKKALLAELEGA